MIFIPSRGRPLSIKRFIRQYIHTGAQEPVCILLDEDDAHNYDNIGNLAGVNFVIHGARTHITEIINRGFALYPNEETYGVLADDVIPQTDGWDNALREAAGNNGIAWANDLFQRERLPTHIFMGGDLARALGWISCPAVKHWYADNIWLNISEALECGTYLPDVILEHAHFLNGKSPHDKTYQEQPSHANDASGYLVFHHSGKFGETMVQTRLKLSEAVETAP